MAEEAGGNTSFGRWALGHKSGVERPGYRRRRPLHCFLVLVSHNVFTRSSKHSIQVLIYRGQAVRMETSTMLLLLGGEQGKWQIVFQEVGARSTDGI